MDYLQQQKLSQPDIHSSANILHQHEKAETLHNCLIYNV